MNKITIMGKNPVQEAIRNERSIAKAFLLDSLRGTELDRLLKANASSLSYLTSNQMNERYGSKHGGVVAEVEEYTYQTLSSVLTKVKNKTHSALVLLDGLEDPHNLGAILRSSDATGMDAIIIPKHRSVKLNQTVAKVSTGAIEYVDVVEVTNLVQTINQLKEEGFWIIGVEVDGTTPYHKQDYRGKIALVIGSEGKGISRLVKENCDFLVSIPMLGKVNSLNASVSAALLFYEVIRSRGQNE